MKIIVAHEGKQHSFKTAEALYKQKCLFKYITTIYDKPYSITYFLKFFLKGKIKKKCLSHKTIMFPNNYVIQYCEWMGLLRLFLSKFPFLYKYFPYIYNWLHDSFGRKVAKFAIKNNVDAVIMYDSNANECWNILKDKAPHIKRILDVTIANRLYSYYTYHHDAELYNDSKILIEEKEINDIINQKRIKEELTLTQYFLVGSEFVKKSLLFSNVPPQNIYIVPYGVNNNLFKKNNDLSQHNSNINNPLTLIYVGNVCYRKGIHHLLSVVSEFNDEEINLYIIGSYSKNEEYFTQYKNHKNINFIGFVTHDILFKYYNQADIFILPSLSEGFAQVSLEAMSCGLPIICTTNSGCNDIIENYKNGFIIQSSNRTQLKEKIEWFMTHKDKIKEMGINAMDTASRYTWNYYFDNLNKAIKTICDEK